MTDQRLLVVVSGLPASGKTTLARALGARLPAPVVERDRFAEVCFDALGAGSPAVRHLGSVSYELLLHVARELTAARRPFLVESNFSRSRHAEQLRTLAGSAAYDLAEVHCRAPGDVLLARYAARARSGTRHPRHDDRHRIEEFRKVFDDPARHDDAVVFPDRALVLDTTRPVPLDAVLRHLGARSGDGGGRARDGGGRRDGRGTGAGGVLGPGGRGGGG